MKDKRKFIIIIAVIAALIGVCIVMMIIGRGHTIYFDNKTIDYNGDTYKAFHKVSVSVKGEKTAKLYEKERSSATWMGQNFKMSLVVTADKNGNEAGYDISLKLPYNMDGIIINLPALLSGLPQDAYLAEFIPEPDAEEEVEEINTDEFSIEEFDESGME